MNDDTAAATEIVAPFNYIEEAYQTNSPNYYTDRVPAYIIERLLSDLITVTNQLDIVKKIVFYGREDVSVNAFYSDDPDDKTAVWPEADLFHGIVGAATETGELVEALYKSMFEGQALDTVNVFEEAGDNTWYLALLLRKAGKTFDDVFHNNIDKLRARFPDKFTEYDAKNRDLAVERAILEKGAE